MSTITPRERALEHTVMALCDVVASINGLSPQLVEAMVGLRGRMTADTEPGFLAAHARQVSALARLQAGLEVNPPDEFCGEQDQVEAAA